MAGEPPNLKSSDEKQVEVGDSAGQTTGDTASGDAGTSSAERGAYVFKAGSSLPEDQIEGLNTKQIFLVRYGDELHAITADHLRAAFPECAARYASQAGTVDLRKILPVRMASMQSAIPELIGTIGSNR